MRRTGHKTGLMRRIEAQHGRAVEELLREGLESGRSYEEIAQWLGVTRSTIHIWVWRLGAEVENRRTVTFVRPEALR